MKSKNNFIFFLIMSITFGIITIIIVSLSPTVEKNYADEDLTPYYVLMWVLILGTIAFIIGCVVNRGELKNKKPKPLAQVGGIIISGLPIPTALSVYANLYSDIIEFDVPLNFSGSRRQTINLSLEKISRVEKLFNIEHNSFVSQSTQTATISSNYDNNGHNHDVLFIEYSDNEETKQILIKLPLTASVSKFIKTIERLNPQVNQQQIIDL